MTTNRDDGNREMQSAPAYPVHHIADDMLLAYAAGTLGEAAAVVAATHLALCPRCLTTVLTAEIVGGALLDEMPPEDISPAIRVAAMDCLDDDSAEPEANADALAPMRADTALGVLLPQPVLDYMPRDANGLRWSWVSPGVKFAALLTDDRGARVGLMRTMPGAVITPHSHSGDELTLVLGGGFRDGAVSFRRGDVQAVDESITHEPATDQDDACLSLVMVQGPVRPTRWIAKIFRHFTAF
jgi:putative transcriptional regulator